MGNIFNEKSHAFIAAKYYRYLKDSFEDRGVKAFIHGTQYYAEQRGRRMAQRAIRDGKELTYETYCQYGEWVNTEYVKDLKQNNTSIVHSRNPDLLMNLTMCPWNSQFREMGEVEAGVTYCTHLDNSICRGFNPYIVYEVKLDYENKEICEHRILNVNFDDNTDMKKRPENLRDFEFHCAHSYWAYSEVSTAIFGIDGQRVALKVLEDFEETYGKDAASTLMKYKYTNFNVTY